MLELIDVDSDELWCEKRPEVLAGFRYKLSNINHVSGPKIIVDLGGGTDIFNGLLADLGNEVSVFDILKFDDAWIGENNNFDASL